MQSLKTIMLNAYDEILMLQLKTGLSQLRGRPQSCVFAASRVQRPRGKMEKVDPLQPHAVAGSRTAPRKAASSSAGREADGDVPPALLL